MSPGESVTENSKRLTPTHDDLIELVRECCPCKSPVEGERHTLKMNNGMQILFEPIKAMRTIAKGWKKTDLASTKAKHLLVQLPWAQEWLLRNVVDLYPNAKSGSGRLINKDAKIKMLSIVYPADDGPHSKHVIPVQMIDGVWKFKCVNWLDDIANNWLGGYCAVTLSREQKNHLEKLEWFQKWIKNLGEKRKRKRRRVQLEQERLEFDSNLNDDCVVDAGASSATPPRLFESDDDDD
jgi:hypothetical protein